MPWRISGEVLLPAYSREVGPLNQYTDMKKLISIIGAFLGVIGMFKATFGYSMNLGIVGTFLFGAYILVVSIKDLQDCSS